MGNKHGGQVENVPRCVCLRPEDLTRPGPEGQYQGPGFGVLPEPCLLLKLGGMAQVDLTQRVCHEIEACVPSHNKQACVPSYDKQACVPSNRGVCATK